MNLDMIIRFGKYKGRTVKWVMYNDRRYFNWAQENAPQMFEDYKPAAKPQVSDTKVVGNPRSLDTESEGESEDSWSNPHAFFRIVQQMREKGEI
jgi:hypothetical protein